MEKVTIANKNSMKWHLKREMSIMKFMLFYLQIGYQKLTLRNPTSKERNQRKMLSIKELRDMLLKSSTKANLQICYVRIIEIVNDSEDIETQQEIRVPNYWVIKLIKKIISIYLIIYIYYFLLGEVRGMVLGEVHNGRFHHLPPHLPK